jgi:hypothetical protein
MLMNKTKLTFAAAALCGGLLALAPISGAFAAPVAPIGKAATENDFARWFTTGIITIAIIVTGIITIVIIVTVGGATAIATAASDKGALQIRRVRAAACRWRQLRLLI